MKKKLLFILSFFIFASILFAENGIMQGQKSLKVAKTQWFDIIYPEDCEQTAAILYKNADSVLQDIYEMYELEPYFRMPVVLTPTVESFNAYFSNYPYNHIVIYDTGVVDELQVFSKTVLSTFKHELTHAVTYNIKSPLIRYIGKIFGDPVSFSFLLTTVGMAEGATVSSESYLGEGRLNDEYAKQFVKQSKIENDFPGYFDVQGASEKDPRGSYYYFNGAFHKWLQDSYGMEKYADLWYRCINAQNLFFEGAFKNVYGIKINDAWKKFIMEYSVPSIPSNPVESGLVSDFFVSSSSDYSSLNKAGNHFYDLKSSDAGYVYIISDTGEAFFVSREEMSKESIKPKKLYSNNGLEEIGISKDGKYVSLGVLKDSNGNYKRKIIVMNRKNRSQYIFEETGLQHGEIIQDNGDYYLVVNKYHSQTNSILIYKLIEENDRIKGCQLVNEIKLPFELYPTSICGTGDSLFSYIEKSGNSYSICQTSINGKSIKKYALPENYVPRYLSFDGSKLYFSYTKPGSLPRYASLDLKNRNFEFDARDISGGVYNPISENDSIVYYGTFFRQNRILKLKKQAGQIVKVSPKEEIISETPKQNPLYPELQKDVEALGTASFVYNPFSYYKHGILIPSSSLYSNSYDPDHSSSYSLPIGLTYISSNPWTDGLIQLSAGFGIPTRSGAVGLSYSSTGIIDNSLTLSTEFDLKGWKMFDSELLTSKSFYFGKHSSFTFQNRGLVHVGRSNMSMTDYSAAQENTDDPMEYFFIDASSSDMTNYLYLVDQLNLQYQNIHRTSAGKYNYGGFALIGSIYGIYNAKANLSEVFDAYYDTGFAGIAYIPQLLPINNPDGFTVNIPVKVGTSVFCRLNQSYTLFSPQEVFGTYENISLLSEAILFGYDIQKALFNHSGLFVNDFRLSLVYKGSFGMTPELMSAEHRLLFLPEYIKQIATGKTDYSQNVYLKASLGLSPNIGSFANSAYKFYLTGRLGYSDIYNDSGRFYCDLAVDIDF